MTRISTALLAMAALSMAGLTSGARAADVAEACDRLAAHPLDPDKPAHVKGVADAEIGTNTSGWQSLGPGALSVRQACEAAAKIPGSHRRHQFQLGRALEAEKSFQEAAQAYRRASEAGSSAAMVALGSMLIEGEGVQPHHVMAHLLFQQAAAAGHVIGMNNLAGTYAEGLGVTRDAKLAKAWFEKAAAANFNESMFQLGVLAEEDGNDAAAKVWFEKAAGLGHPMAIAMLGQYAEHGRGGPRDKAAAIDLYKRAAALGLEEAKDALELLTCSDQAADQDSDASGKCPDPAQ